MLALFVGTLLAVGVVIALEMLNRRVRSATDLVLALDLPVIGVLPKPASKRPWGARAALAARQRLVGSRDKRRLLT